MKNSAKISEFVEKYQMLAAGDRLVAGISGGADSVCLFFVLLELRRKIPFTFEVLHVHHGLRAEADEDAAFVQKLCAANDIPCHVRYYKIRSEAFQKGISEEEAGRIARYEAFEELMKEHNLNKLVTAHHMDDQAETVLFRMFRGSGLTGLCGIRPVQENRIRPLLCLTKDEIIEMLTEQKISWREDATNQEDHYARNKIRNHILPYAEKEICQGSARHTAEAAEKLQEAEDYIQRVVGEAKIYATASDELPNERILYIPKMRKQDIYIQEQILLQTIADITNARKDITSVHIRDIRKLMEKTGNGQLSLPYGLEVRKSYDELLFTAPEEEEAEDLGALEIISQKKVPQKLEIPVRVPGGVNVPGMGSVTCSVIMASGNEEIPEKAYTKWLDYDKIDESLVLRSRRSGDYITIKGPNGYPVRKSVKEYMINEKIPAADRDEIFLLASGSHVVWIPGYRISEKAKVTDNTRQILQVRLQMKQNETGL
ncbi:MAG: tRNA lysidine(34) synthetase TilS [Lachnospiraceae bacterium]|nr:tRNA lysidine(34) synthetase TilS [Lachnospiraceae bacterium]